MDDGFTIWNDREAAYEEAEGFIDAAHAKGHERAEAHRIWREERTRAYEAIKASQNATAARETVDGVPTVAAARERYDKAEVDEKWCTERALLAKKRFGQFDMHIGLEYGRPSNGQ